MNRAGVTAAPGILFAWLHGELDPNRRVYRLHFHAICTEEKAEAMRKTKGRWGYEKTSSTQRPVVIKNLAKAITEANGNSRERVASYVLQHFWPNRPRYIAETEQGPKFYKGKSRAALPPHCEAEILLWLGAQKPSDFIVAQPNIRMKKHRVP